jgi:hypothetical protein
MEFFGFSAIYLVPLSSFLFVVIFLKAIEKINGYDSETSKGGQRGTTSLTKLAV